MGAGMLGQPGAGSMQSGSSLAPPMGAGMPGQSGVEPLPPVGAKISDQPEKTFIPSAPPAYQDGPYRMIRPKEQNLHPDGEAFFEGKQGKPDQEEKTYSGIEEKEDSNRS